ncbi:MAG: DUF2147 domain-containing protein [Bacteroidales bacterium]|nr:DUF2147 domain-containing protein [Bacteroidales bacterium]
MKKIILSLVLAFVSVFAFGQNALNDKADSILGDYSSTQGGAQYKVHVTKNANGTYKAQIFWVSDPYDKNGKRNLDVKNPNKSLRSVPTDQVVLSDGLQYNAQDKTWGGTKIYDPQRGINAKVTASFEKDGTLKLRGTVLGIGESAYWKRIK